MVAHGRKSLSLAIPEAASTGVDLGFPMVNPTSLIGENEVSGSRRNRATARKPI